MELSLSKTLRRAVIKEELVELTGHVSQAIILNQLIYWSERVRDFDQFIDEERQRAKGACDETTRLSRGWIYKKADELSTETMLNVSKSTMMTHIKALLAGGWIEQRHNPRNKMDKTFQYRVNLIKIQCDLMAKGLTLEGYRVPVDFMLAEVPDAGGLQGAETSYTDSENELGSSDSELRSFRVVHPSTNFKRHSSKFELGSPNIEQQYQRLLAEIMAETSIGNYKHGRTREGPDFRAFLLNIIHDIDKCMRRHTGQENSVLRHKDGHSIYQLVVENGIPLKFILEGIQSAVNLNPAIQHFSDCAPVIAKQWTEKLHKRNSMRPPHVLNSASIPAQGSRSSGRHKNGRTSKRDPRYAAFYELFPDS